jgi:prolyl 4-hydroxylase
MNQPSHVSSLEQFTNALGRAAYQFMVLEWSVAWLTETLAPGSISNSRNLTCREAATRFEEAIYQLGDVPAVSARLIGFANRFGQLVDERDRLLHGHPHVADGAELQTPGQAEQAEMPPLLFTGKAGRKVWTTPEVEALAAAFEEAAAEAVLILGKTAAALSEEGAAEPAQAAAGEPPAVVSYQQLGKSDPQFIVEQANQVRARLDAHPATFRMPAKNLEIYVAPNFLTAKESAELIALIESDLIPSNILANNPDPAFRTSYSCNLNPANPLVASLDGRIAELLGIEQSHSETVQGQRYAVGQEFRPHYDFFHTGQNYTDLVEQTGGQRTWTAMVFLNEPEAGGCTNFPDAGVKITPKTGNLLIWNNNDLYGQPNHFSRHQGMPVEAGLKYVVTKWFRERVWIRADLLSASA